MYRCEWHNIYLGTWFEESSGVAKYLPKSVHLVW